MACSGDDQLLEAAKGADQPHRVKRARFTETTKWQLTSDGFVNCKWRKVAAPPASALDGVLIADIA